MTYSISNAGLEALKREEGKRLTSYKDSRGVWTIGYGSTGPHVGPGQRITDKEAEDLLKQDLTRFEYAVNKNVKVPVTQNQYDAMVSLSYNIGDGGFAKSDVVKKLNSFDYEGAAASFRNWSKAGNNSTVLAARREREIGTFMNGHETTTKPLSNLFPVKRLLRLALLIQSIYRNQLRRLTLKYHLHY